MVSRALARQWTPIQASARTVRRRLYAAGLKGLIAPEKPALTAIHRRQRLQFAQDHQNWTIAEWKNGVWTDETPIYLTVSAQNRYICTREGLAARLTLARPTHHSGRSHIMVWGGFYGSPVLPLRRINGNLNGERYLEILQNVVSTCPNSTIWMDDNAPCHRACIVKQWMVSEQRETMSWPAQSPDLNPIENAWAELKRRIECKNVNSLDELWNLSKIEWQEMQESFLVNLVESMPRRIAAVLKVKGGHTKY